MADVTSCENALSGTGDDQIRTLLPRNISYDILTNSLRRRFLKKRMEQERIFSLYLNILGYKD